MRRQFSLFVMFLLPLLVSANNVSVFASISEGEEIPEINGHAYVDLGLPSGKVWATTNYGATSEGDYGTYVNWSTRSVVQESWGSEWSTPNDNDLEELYNNCTFTWETNSSSVYGCRVTGPDFSRFD